MPLPKSPVDDVLESLRRVRELPQADRVAAYNRLSNALAELVADVSTDPVLSVQLIAAAKVRPNDYNPNRVAAPELELLEMSIREDGVTMPVVVVYDPKRKDFPIVDGFHRRTTIADRLGRAYIPCTVIDKPIANRMASTVRHNRARGKHQVDGMGALVRKLLLAGWEDAAIAEHLGMTEEELLRLKQIEGVAKLLAAPEYSQSWGRTDESDRPDD